MYIRSNNAIVVSAGKGLKTKVFYDFAETKKMPEKNLAFIINLSARTISNYKEKRKNLEPLYSEHLLKLIVLFEKGEEVFGYFLRISSMRSSGTSSVVASSFINP